MRKGALAMHLLQERVGEDRVNAALKNLLQRYRFKGAPYPRSLDLVEALRAETETPLAERIEVGVFTADIDRSSRDNVWRLVDPD
jgi:hypothetical protein